MKRKFALAIGLALIIACLFVLSISAKTVISERNIDGDGDIVADIICKVEGANDETHIVSVDMTYTSTDGTEKTGKIYYLISLWTQQNKRQMEIIYLPSDFDMSQVVYFCDKVDISGDGQYSYNEFMLGTRGGAFYIKTYGAFTGDSFTDTADVKKTGVQAVSYSKYLTYFGPNAFSGCSALNSVTYNGHELEEFACIISASVCDVMSGAFGGDGGGDYNTVSTNFTRLVFEDREGGVSFGQYAFTRNEIVEVVFGKGQYYLGGRDKLSHQFVTEGSKEYSLKRIVLSKDAVIASGEISWLVGSYDVIVLGNEDECAQIYETNCQKAMKNASTVTYNPCYFGHISDEDDGDCTTPVLCSFASLYI